MWPMMSFTLWRLNRQLRRGNSAYSTSIAKAKGEEQQALIAEWIDEREHKRDEILSTRSMLLQEKAERLAIPVPPLSDKQSWVDGRRPGTVHLSLESQNLLLKTIRAEQREKWTTLKEIGPTITGLIGAMMGVLSLLHSFYFK